VNKNLYSKKIRDAYWRNQKRKKVWHDAWPVYVVIGGFWVSSGLYAFGIYFLTESTLSAALAKGIAYTIAGLLVLVILVFLGWLTQMFLKVCRKVIEDYKVSKSQEYKDYAKSVEESERRRGIK